MKLGFSPEDEAFRLEARAWVRREMEGPFADIRHITSLTAKSERRKVW
ncbi:MAG: acyl-CoA dehydrogenase, partial [Alphaproteobacteria bacterium]|nr:acyl-CoA dehydrogenase [Alphaproteobacteria bacterium]